MTGGWRKRPKADAEARVQDPSTRIRSQTDSCGHLDDVDDVELTNADRAFLDYVAVEAVRLYLARTGHKR